jgi:general secretion pathway protein G
VRQGRRSERGISFIEIMAVTALLSILAMAVLPTVKSAQKRAKELELKAALRELRLAIDKYRMYCDPQVPLPKKIPVRDPPYPERLEELVQGPLFLNQSVNKLRILRKIPEDPMTGDTDWGLRCYSDDQESTSWCGRDIYDVYSKSKDTGLNGRPYSRW